MQSEKAGLTLACAAALFWLSWFLMPGVGVTDAAQIFDLVARQRPLVMLSVISQLVSAVLYVPALLGISCSSTETSERQVRWGASLLLLGAMGSAVDAVLHLLAYAMTMPGLERTELLKVMAFMQGPGLRLIAPLILSFLVGSIVLAVALMRSRAASRTGVYMHVMALGVGVGGGIAVADGILPGRAIGLLVLGAISMAQVSLGLELHRGRYPAALTTAC